VNDVNNPPRPVIAKTFGGDTFGKKNMNLLYPLAVILIICWAIGFFAYSLGTLIHALLIIALITVLLQVIRSRRI
jgi:hypothetical protein